MAKVLFFLTLFSSLISIAECTLLVGKYTCNSSTNEVIYVKSALLNGERFYKINDVVRSYEGKLALVNEINDNNGQNYSFFTKSSCENGMLIDSEVYRITQKDSAEMISVAKKILALDQFGDLIILEGAINIGEKFDINNPPGDVKKVNCYRD